MPDLERKKDELESQGVSFSAYITQMVMRDIGLGDHIVESKKRGRPKKPESEKGSEPAEAEEEGPTEEEPEETPEAQPDFKPVPPTPPANKGMTGTCNRCGKEGTVYDHEGKPFCSECLDAVFWS